MEMNANNILLLQIIMHIFPMIVSLLIKRKELYEDTYINTIYLESYYAIIVLDIQLRCIKIHLDFDCVDALSVC